MHANRISFCDGFLLSPGGLTQIEDESINMIFCELPYGSTQNPWDTIIPSAAAPEGRRYIGMGNEVCEREESPYFGQPWADIAIECIATMLEAA